MLANRLKVLFARTEEEFKADQDHVRLLEKCVMNLTLRNDQMRGKALEIRRKRVANTVRNSLSSSNYITKARKRHNDFSPSMPNSTKAYNHPQIDNSHFELRKAMSRQSIQHSDFVRLSSHPKFSNSKESYFETRHYTPLKMVNEIPENDSSASKRLNPHLKLFHKTRKSTKHADFPKYHTEHEANIKDEFPFSASNINLQLTKLDRYKPKKKQNSLKSEEVKHLTSLVRRSLEHSKRHSRVDGCDGSQKKEASNEIQRKPKTNSSSASHIILKRKSNDKIMPSTQEGERITAKRTDFLKELERLKLKHFAASKTKKPRTDTVSGMSSKTRKPDGKTSYSVAYVSQMVITPSNFKVESS